MRPLLPLALLAAASLAIGQAKQGTYRPTGGAPGSWSINPHHTLIWNGSPYMPVGVRIGGSEEEIQDAKRAGVGDVLLELSAGSDWAAAFSRAEAAGVRYLASVSSMAPMARGFAVEPASYRIPGITTARRIELNLNATTALAVLITKHDQMVERVTRVKIENNRFVLDVKPLNDLDHTLLIYPDVKGLSQTDFWEEFDGHRDRLLKSVRDAKPGQGLRGIINPLGTVLSIASSTPNFVPTSPSFRAEYAGYLERKYRTTATLERAWLIGAPDLATFQDYSRLVPLWSGNRGIYHLWDPKTDRLYPVESKRSAVWTDVQGTINATAVRRYQRLVLAIRKIVDVPIVQEWAGWAAPYESSTPVIDGLGMRVSGATPSAIAEGGSRVTSSILRWPGPGWLLATDVDLSSVQDAATQLPNVLQDLTNLGSRGWFFKPIPGALPVLASEAARISTDGAAAQWSPSALFFPENALNPARPQSIGGGKWWLPSPASGNRLDFGTKFFGYRYRDDRTNFTAIWTVGPARRVKLRMLQPKVATFRASDGSDPKPKMLRDGVEVLLGELPLLIEGTDEIPVPEPAMQEAVFRFEELLKLAELRHILADEENFFFREAIASFDQNPGGSHASLRSYYWKLNARMGDFNWIEAEASRVHTFSESALEAGCSNGSVLSLRAPLAAKETDGYFAEFNVSPKSKEPLEVWISARVPGELRDNVRVLVGDQAFVLQGEPISRYGLGFGWYKLGSVTLVGRAAKLRIEVDVINAAELAIDTILLFPGGFTPNGVTPPEAMIFPELPIKR
ncbi:MAG: hypothetical protein WAO58_05765 [Fimbriimonadaceae bacterium]